MYHIYRVLSIRITVETRILEVKVFDMKPYLDIGIFKELKDLQLFNSVKPFLGSIQWKNGQDLCPDTLYLEST